MPFVSVAKTQRAKVPLLVLLAKVFLATRNTKSLFGLCDLCGQILLSPPTSSFHEFQIKFSSLDAYTTLSQRFFPHHEEKKNTKPLDSASQHYNLTCLLVQFHANAPSARLRALRVLRGRVPPSIFQQEHQRSSFISVLASVVLKTPHASSVVNPSLKVLSTGSTENELRKPQTSSVIFLHSVEKTQRAKVPLLVLLAEVFSHKKHQKPLWSRCPRW